MMISVLLLFICILLVYNYYRYHGKNRQLINLIPGPPTFLFFGNILDFQIQIEKLWNVTRNLHKEYYPIYRLWILFRPMVTISHPDDLETILTNTKHVKKGTIYRSVEPWLGTGLLTSTGPKWHKKRKILTPAFHFNILQQFIDTFAKEGECMTKSLKESKETVVKDLVPFISEYTLNAICETAMGTSLNDLGEFQYRYRQAVLQMGHIILHKLMRPWLFDKLFLLTSMGRKQARNLKILHGFTEKVIAERKLYHESSNGRYLKNFGNDNTSEANDAGIIGKKRLAMLDLLLAKSEENNITDLEIREEVDTFMFEGHDTTAMAICFTLLLLAEHKDIQDRVRDEVNSVLQESDGKFNMSSLQNLVYLDRCLKESLRLYPSVHMISRIIAEDVKLQSYVVPAGIDVRLNIYDLHRDPNFWPNPTVFDPDRFLPEKIQNRHPFSYIPFSAGIRNCIGQRYAMLEMKAMIAPLVHNFYIEPVDYLKDLQITPDLVLRPAHPVHVKFVPVE